MKCGSTKLVVFVFFLLFGPASANADSIPDNKEIHFQILRNGNSFGTHSMEFSENDKGQTVVNIDIRMDYYLGPINLFDYEHVNREIWSGNKILSVNSETYDNGEKYSVKAKWYEDYVDIQTQREVFDASAKIYSTSYWNKEMLKADQLLNTQKGNIEDVQITSLGVEDIISEGQNIKAQAYQIDANVPIKVWYAVDTQEWVKLRFTIRGSELEYVRVAQNENKI